MCGTGGGTGGDIGVRQWQCVVLVCGSVTGCGHWWLQCVAFVSSSVTGGGTGGCSVWHWCVTVTGGGTGGCSVWHWCVALVVQCMCGIGV